MIDWRAISLQAGIELKADSVRSQVGGSISTAFRVESAQGPVFIKLEPAGQADRLEAEADGLKALAATAAVRVPGVIACGTADCTRPEAGDGQAFLIIEWIEAGRARAAATLGARLAALHGHAAERFGWHRDNFIGATPQPNSETDSWVAFMRARRLGFQLELAARQGHRLDQTKSARLLESLDLFYSDYQPRPSLLHGDLWAGNWLVDQAGQPVVFDPAVYFGDREADIAMTELFGGFGADFYAAYAAAWPLDPGYRVRRDLHKLYHVLNHLNLFGGAYLNQACALLEGLHAEIS